MNAIKKLGLVVAIAGAAFGPALTAQAAGLLIAEGGFGGVLEIKEHDVQVTIKDRKSTRLNSSHGYISYAVFCLKKKKKKEIYPDALVAQNRLLLELIHY